MTSPRDSASVGGGGPPAATRGGPTDPSHDRDLRRGVLRTTVSRPVAGFLALAFLATIYAVPITQVIMDKRSGEESVLPDLFARWPTRDTIKQFEDDLEKASSPREWIKPRLQLVLTRLGGFGNTKAIVGRKGWLFYQPGVAAIGGPGLLDSSIIESRIRVARDAGEPPLFPDPRPAILGFRAYLADRGINLVLFPVPDKAALQPSELRGPRAADADRPPAANPDHARLLSELRAAGVLVFDPTPDRLDRNDPPRFLRQDTHWTPAWMEQVAGSLARFVVGRGLLAPAPVTPRTWTVVEKTVSRVGDLVDMLGLPPGQTAFVPQTISIREVRSAAGGPFEPDRGADVLLLGDSFCNVFTLGQMGWGEAAGLGPHLARALGRDVDIIAQNDAGAHATRQLLRNEVSADNGAGDDRQRDGTSEPGDRLSGKKLVIWEFAARELAVGNWKPIAWPRPASGTRPAAQRRAPQDDGVRSTDRKGQAP
jgi:SGNH hydrolase-like domain, acetyltransferase AlgX